MCGRFAVTTDPALLAEKINAIDERVAHDKPDQPNYNVAPTTTIATVVCRHSEPHDEPTRRLRSMRWGLVPPWVKAASDGTPEAKGPLLINARSERVTTSPAYRASAKTRRCLVPMDGYYEWKPAAEAPAGKKGRKTPFYIYREDGRPLLMAGLWSSWRPEGKSNGEENDAPLLSCTIVTTDAVGGLADVHDRMPLVVAPEDWDRWLDPDEPAPLDLLAKRPDITGIRMHEVSTLVNSVRNNGPELIDRDAARWGAAGPVLHND
ncbi:MAG: SOS response-associated peptidase [Mycobacterium sp.]